MQYVQSEEYCKFKEHVKILKKWKILFLDIYHVCYVKAVQIMIKIYLIIVKIIEYHKH